MADLTIIFKDSERTYTQKFQVHQEFDLFVQHPNIQKYIQHTRLNFNGQPDDVILKITADI